MIKMPEIHCSLQYLVDKLPFVADDVSIEKFGNPNMNLYVDELSLYSVDEKQPRKSGVYLCRPEQLATLDQRYQGSILLCVSNNGPLKHIPEGYQILVIQCSQSPEFVFNKLQKTIVNIKRNNGRIDRAILEESDLQDILPIVEQTMKNPFLLLDAEFKLLGWSKAKECSEELYADTVCSGYLSNTYVMELIAQDCLRKLYEQGTVILPKGQLLPQHTAVIVMLRNEHLILGYGIMICSQRELRQPMIQGFQEIMGKFKTSLIKHTDISYAQNKSEILFYLMLLNGSITDQTEIRQKAQALNLCCGGEYTLYVLQCMGNIPSRYAFMPFIQTVPDGETVFLYDEGILVVERSDNRKPGLPGRPAFHQFLSDYDALAGSSTLFCHPEEIPNAYMQAKQSIEIGRLLSASQENMYFDYDKRVFRYPDYAPYLLIEKYYQETRHFPLTCLRLLQMMDQDEKKKSDYTRTLLVYLKNNGHIMDTAQELFFHRNSILKRIKQISDLLQLDLGDYNTRAELLFNFKILDCARALGKTEALMDLIH